MFLKNNMDKTDFKFVSYISFNEALEIVYEFFTSSGRDANLTVVSKDKIFINTYYKNNNYQLILSVYKLSSVKFILMFSYRAGILTKFNKIMKTFFDKYKTYFKLF